MTTTFIDNLSSKSPVSSLISYKLDDSTYTYILAGYSGFIDIYNYELNSKKTIEVFENHKVNGINFKNLRGGLVIVYGSKSLKIFDKDFNILCDTIETKDFILFCDLYEDVNIQEINVIIGYAHNYIEVKRISDPRKSMSIKNLEVCVLFSMNNCFISSDVCSIASGTALGTIFIWNVDLSKISSDLQPENSIDKISKNNFDFDKIGVTNSKKLIGHKGVIFKVLFNSNKSKIASVSDDRSVRVWDIETSSQLFVGWGHVCRVWDVIFYGDEDENENVITAGEDLNIKIWNITTGNCEATFKGHTGKSCWKVFLVPDNRHVVSSGNDAAIKVWDVESQKLASPENSDLICEKIRLFFLYFC